MRVRAPCQRADVGRQPQRLALTLRSATRPDSIARRKRPSVLAAAQGVNPFVTEASGGPALSGGGAVRPRGDHKSHSHPPRLSAARPVPIQPS